jgi:catechol 2,3-dioxygenase-like lactoylglutathione lyase family enzyme
MSTATSKASTILSTAPTHATIPVTDLDRAKEFYGGTLGLELLVSNPGGHFWQTGDGTRIFTFKRPEASSGEHTMVGFRVQDIKTAVLELKGRGVVFEEYDEGGLTTVDSIATMGPISAAWFKDPDGNIIGIVAGVA